MRRGWRAAQWTTDMLARRYEMPWRRAYESYAGIGWLAAMAFFVIVGATLRLPRSLALPLSLIHISEPTRPY